LKHVEDSDKHIIKEIVRQVGYLPELYEAALDLNYMIQFLHAYSSKMWKSIRKKPQHSHTHMLNPALCDTEYATFSIKESIVHITKFAALQIYPVHYIH
jgi:predicted RNA methylase